MKEELNEELDATQPKKKPTPKKNDDEKVVISKAELESLQKDIEILKRSVSRARLDQATSKVEGEVKEEPKGFLKKLNGKVIVKWFGINEPGSKAKQEILYQGTTPIGEILKGHYVTIDGEEILEDAIRFYRSTDLAPFVKLGQEGDSWIIQFEDPSLPQEFKISTKFINP